MAREMKDSGIEWIGEIPKDWGIRKIKYIANNDINSFIDGDWIESPFITDKGIYYFTTGNIGDGYFKEKNIAYITKETFDELNCKYAYSGDLIFSRLNAPYGRSCILPDFVDKCVLAVDNVILRTDNNSAYICYVTQCSGYHDAVFDKSAGTTMKRISRTNLGKIQLPLPPLLEQQKIADFLDQQCAEIDSVIAHTRISIEEYKKLKQSVITQAVTKGLNPNVEMKDSGIEWIGEIPEKWEIRTIGTLFNYIGGNAYKSDLYVDKSKNQIIRIGNVKNGFLKLDANPVYISDETAEETYKYKIRSGMLLFTMTGTKGKRDYFFTHLVTESDVNSKNLYLNQRVGAFIPNKNINMSYYGYLLKENNILDIVFMYETGTANQGNIGIESIRRIKIQFPSLSEQQQIADYLDTKCAEIETLITKKEQFIMEMEAYKKSLIYEYVTGKKEVVLSA